MAAFVSLQLQNVLISPSKYKLFISKVLGRVSKYIVILSWKRAVLISQVSFLSLFSLSDFQLESIPTSSSDFCLDTQLLS